MAKLPTKEQVRKKYQNADKVVSAMGSLFYMKDYDLDSIEYDSMLDAFFIRSIDGTDHKALYDAEIGKWAEIKTEKTPENGDS